MSGSPDKEYIPEDPEVEKVMQRFNVDEKTAEGIVLYAVEYARKRMDRWQNNLMRRVNKRLKEMEEQYKKDVNKGR